jgi:hypothetical protein
LGCQVCVIAPSHWSRYSLAIFLSMVALNHNLCISASQVARITSMSHWGS